MAAFDTTRPMSNASGVGSFTKFVASAFGAVAAWNDNRVTRNALAKLTDRNWTISVCAARTSTKLKFFTNSIHNQAAQDRLRGFSIGSTRFEASKIGASNQGQR